MLYAHIIDEHVNEVMGRMRNTSSEAHAGQECEDGVSARYG